MDFPNVKEWDTSLLFPFLSMLSVLRSLNKQVYSTENVESEHERLTGLGLEPTDIISPAPGVQFFFVKDLSGVQIQLIQG